MTDPAPELPPWVQPYEPDFRELLRQLDLVPGFIFQPVVLPSPDLARALADWLAAQGLAVRVFDMRVEPWNDLAVRLRTLTFDSPAERRAVVVITPSDLDRAAIGDGLAAVNFSRDSIAEHLNCPLLWCGDVELLRTTAELATDLWSIAATVYRIPLRALSDGSSGRTARWWTGAVRDDETSIAAKIEAARLHGDLHGVAEASLDLAENQLARGLRSEAAAGLAALKRLVEKYAPALSVRWHVLDVAARSDDSSADAAIAEIQAKIAAAQARDAAAVEATLWADLARWYDRTGRKAAALEALLAARALLFRTGDDAAAIDVERRLTLGHQLPPPLVSELRAHARHILFGRFPPRIRVTAWLVLAELAEQQQRWSEVDHAAAAALRECSPSGADELGALHLRWSAAAHLGDWAAAQEHSTQLLESGLAQRVSAVAMVALHRRGHARLSLGRRRDACRDFIAARDVAIQLGDRGFAATAARDLAATALRLGALDLHAALLPRALASTLGAGSALSSDSLAAVPADDELADIVGALTDDPASRPPTIARLGALADARERALRDRGIDRYDVDTWRPSQPDPT